MKLPWKGVPPGASVRFKGRLFIVEANTLGAEDGGVRLAGVAKVGHPDGTALVEVVHLPPDPLEDDLTLMQLAQARAAVVLGGVVIGARRDGVPGWAVPASLDDRSLRVHLELMHAPAPGLFRSFGEMSARHAILHGSGGSMVELHTHEDEE